MDDLCEYCGSPMIYADEPCGCDSSTMARKDALLREAAEMLDKCELEILHLTDRLDEAAGPIEKEIIDLITKIEKEVE